MSIRTVCQFFILIFFISPLYVKGQIPGGDSPSVTRGKHFIHTTEGGNTSGNWTLLDHSYLNGNPNAIVFVEQNNKPNGVEGVLNNHHIGVWYTSDNWSIFNQDGESMDEDISFNIFVPDSVDTNAFIHNAAIENITDNKTVLSHPLLDGNPDAKILITSNWNENFVYNNSPTGVMYDGSNWVIFNEDMSPMPEGAAFNIYVLNNKPASFVHNADAGNISDDITIIDHPLLNNNPYAMIYVTKNYQGTYDTCAIGVWYTGTWWAVKNQDLSDIQPGSSYYVYIGPQYFVHTTNVENISGDLTTFNHPLINNNPDAKIFVTQNRNPGGIGSMPYDKSLGVYYTGSAWGIFTQDVTNIPQDVSFNVAISLDEDSAFHHTSTLSNIGENSTNIDNPLINDNPNARIIVTPVYISTRHDKVIGVWYSAGKWKIYNQDLSSFVEGKDFFVLVLNEENSLVHVADNANTTLNYTVIDHPALNNNPDANIIVTQNFEVNSVYNNNEVGVMYVNNKWAIFNENLNPMPDGAAFNVYIAGLDGETTVDVKDKFDFTTVDNFSLEQNYPNPFNPSTQISFTIGASSKVSLKIYDILGNEIATLFNEEKSAGSYTVSFNSPADLASGLYFYQLQAGNFTASKKMLLIK
jgi:hypothetical protein